MTLSSKEDLIKEIYDNLKEDYIGFWIIYFLVKDAYGILNDVELQTKVREYVQILISDKTVKVGDFEKLSQQKDLYRFIPWDGNVSDKVSKFLQKWGYIGFSAPDIGEVCYFALQINK